jgi:hypothetical protein
MSALSLWFLALTLQGSAAKKISWPDSVPSPFALFRLDEGSGMELNNQHCEKDSSAPSCTPDKILKSNKGRVFVQPDHQPDFDADTGDCGGQLSSCHPGANWQEDEHFGNVLNCGNGDTAHKDAIQLPDLDYGKEGHFAMNWWMKHEEGHENYDSEYILTHGAPYESTGARNHIFMYMRGTGLEGGRRRREGVADDGVLPWIRANIVDGDEPPLCDQGLAGRRRRRSDVKKAEYTCKEGDLPEGHPLPEDECDGTKECFSHPNPSLGTGACCCKTNAEAALDPNYKCLTSEQPNGGTADTNFTVDCPLDDMKWHMFTLTTNKKGKGWRFYIDGALRSSNPDLSGDEDGQGTGTRPEAEEWNIYAGDPIDPNSTINFCGRDQWTGWHANRYFLGRMAHISIFNVGLSRNEVWHLFNAYFDQFGFDIDPKCKHHRTRAPTRSPTAATPRPTKEVVVDTAAGKVPKALTFAATLMVAAKSSTLS